jgi:hypothetical protein
MMKLPIFMHNSYYIAANENGATMAKIKIRSLFFAVVLMVFAWNGLAAESWTWYNIPHVAAGGGWTSYLTIQEPIGVARSIYVYFYDDNGAALTLNVDGVAQPGGFNFTLAANQERVFALTGGSSTLTGQVQVAAQTVGNLNVSLRFASTSSGTVSDVVGIMPVEANSYWTLTVEKRQSNDDTGVAIANPYITTRDITVTFGLFQNGLRVPGTTNVSRNIKSLGHSSFFVSQLFPGISYVGVATLKISSLSDTFVAVALRADQLSQYSSMPTDAGVQYWNVLISGVSGSEVWGFRFIDGYTFIGYGSNPDNARIRLRGVYAWDLNPQYFLAEWNWINSTLGTQGSMIYQGTVSSSGNTITGIRIELKSDGTILSSHPFTASRAS